MSAWTAVDNEGATLDLDNLATQKWLDGQCVGCDAVMAWLRMEAVKLFEAGDDAKAKELRDLAARLPREVKTELAQAAARHSKDHPYRSPYGTTPPAGGPK